ncbi:MAG: apolipoprotein N-acyltransferase [Rectinemataceae bacterium]|nr:apolipoprotein N-acyltransferase [Rectinemataceae bacterium]
MLATMVLPIFSALLCAISIPNEILLSGFWPLGFIALIPFYLALHKARTPRQAALAGAIFGACHHALTSYWLFFYRGFAFWTLGTSAAAYAVVYAVLGLYGHFILRSESPSYRPFVFAVGWASFEFLKSTGFLGYPWGLIPYSLSAVPLLLQTADTMGVYGLSFLLALASGIGAEYFLARGNPLKRMRDLVGGAAFLAFLIFLVLVYGLAVQLSPIPQKATLRATLVQQNSDPWLAGELPTLQTNVALAREAYETNIATGGDPIDLIVFSETTLRRPFAEYRDWFGKNPGADPLLPFIAESGAQLLTGAPVVLNWETWESTNSVLLISSQGELIDSYAKVHPVPFAEAIPLWEYSWFRTFMQEVVGLESGWVMGTSLTLFPIAPKSAPETSLSFATPICFEDAFADLCRQYFLAGADLLINLTNDSWSLKKSAQIQHWAIARIRAIENRRTLVRSTNSGLSCVVDPWGRVLWDMPQFEAAAITVDIPVYKPTTATIYTRYGEWFAQFCTLLLAFRFIMDYMRFRRKHRYGGGL